MAHALPKSMHPGGASIILYLNTSQYMVNVVKVDGPEITVMNPLAQNLIKFDNYMLTITYTDIPVDLL